MYYNKYKNCFIKNQINIIYSSNNYYGNINDKIYIII